MPQPSSVSQLAAREAENVAVDPADERSGAEPEPDDEAEPLGECVLRGAEEKEDAGGDRDPRGPAVPLEADELAAGDVRVREAAGSEIDRIVPA